MILFNAQSSARSAGPFFLETLRQEFRGVQRAFGHGRRLELTRAEFGFRLRGKHIAFRAGLALDFDQQPLGLRVEGGGQFRLQPPPVGVCDREANAADQHAIVF